MDLGNRGNILARLLSRNIVLPIPIHLLWRIILSITIGLFHHLIRRIRILVPLNLKSNTKALAIIRMINTIRHIL
jgi:hypothetical protein